MVRIYTCPDCKEKFNQKGHYDRHLKRKIPCICKDKSLNQIIEEKVSKALSKKLTDNKITSSDDESPKKINKSKQKKTSSDTSSDNESPKKINKSKQKKTSSDTSSDNEFPKKINKSKQKNSPKKNKSKFEETIERDLSYLRLAENEVIFELKDDDNNNEKIKKILSVIDKAHNILFQSESIVGQKALQVIMSLLFIKLIQPYLSDKEEEGKIDLLNIKHYEDKYYDKKEELQKIFGYFKDLKNITKMPEKDIRNNTQNDIIKKMGEILKRHPITKNIYTEVNFIKVREGSTIKTIINTVIDNINFADFDNNEDVIGEIYEFFLTKYMKSKSKELGQFFTPRKLMKLILNYKKERINEIFKDKKNISIYDSCMGTGGWLVCAYNMLKAKLCCSIYGGEVETDTYQYGLMNLILTLKKFPSDVACNSSLTHINKMLYDLIVTNPPFNSKKQIKFSQIKDNFEKDEYTKNNKINIDDIFKLKKDEPPIQFLELDTYKLNENGLCIIVLPYGEFFSGSSYQKTREYFMKEVNITDIIIVPGGIFTYTDIKTCVLVYEKNKKGTSEIDFLEINGNCNSISRITTIKKSDFDIEPCKSWFYSDYLNDKLVTELCAKMSNFEWVEFGKVFTLEKGKLQSSKVFEDEEGDVLFVSKSEITDETILIKTDDYYENGLFIANAFNGNGRCPIRYTEEKCIHSDLMLKIIIKEKYINRINIKYIYHFLRKLQSHIESSYNKGACNQSLDIKNFNRMKIQIPSLKQQDKCIDAINHMEEIIKRWEDDIDDILNNGSNKFLEMLESSAIQQEIGSDDIMKKIFSNIDDKELDKE